MVADGDGNFLLAEIRSLNEDYPHWSTISGVYLRPKSSKGPKDPDGAGYEIVGIDRESPEKSTFPMN